MERNSKACFRSYGYDTRSCTIELKKCDLLKGYIFSTGLKNRAASCIIIMRSETCLRISFHRASLSAPSRSSISWRRSEIPGKAEAPYKLNFPGAKMAFRDSGRPGSPRLFDKNQNE